MRNRPWAISAYAFPDRMPGSHIPHFIKPFGSFGISRYPWPKHCLRSCVGANLVACCPVWWTNLRFHERDFRRKTCPSRALRRLDLQLVCDGDQNAGCSPLSKEERTVSSTIPFRAAASANLRVQSSVRWLSTLCNLSGWMSRAHLSSDGSKRSG